MGAAARVSVGALGVENVSHILVCFDSDLSVHIIAWDNSIVNVIGCEAWVDIASRRLTFFVECNACGPVVVP